jgi:hypothetical protein
MKTHVVTDINYKDKNPVFVGTLTECENWVTLIGSGTYVIREMTDEELKINNPQLLTD